MVLDILGTNIGKSEQAGFESDAGQKQSTENQMKYLLYCLCGLEPTLGHSLVRGERFLFDHRDLQLHNLDSKYMLVYLL